jgi:hypothetical protein
MGLTEDIGLRGVMLGVERVEVLLKPMVGGHAGVGSTRRACAGPLCSTRRRQASCMR